jgi:N-acetylglucosaminyldiphosphoundecaprenol N-acetyl-beta-D-mannosaminyltransferase
LYAQIDVHAGEDGVAVCQWDCAVFGAVMYRLASEPRRLWKRYLVTNTLFVLGAAKQLLLKK